MRRFLDSSSIYKSEGRLIFFMVVCIRLTSTTIYTRILVYIGTDTHVCVHIIILTTKRINTYLQNAYLDRDFQTSLPPKKQLSDIILLSIILQTHLSEAISLREGLVRGIFELFRHFTRSPASWIFVNYWEDKTRFSWASHFF